MKKWSILGLAIASEVTASLALRGALDHRGWYTLVAAGYITSFICLGLVLRLGVPLGVAYGIWGALGVALTAVLSAALFSEPLNGTTFLGLGLIIAGVLCVELGSRNSNSGEVTS